MTDNIFRFTHETVDAVTITNEDGSQQTFLDTEQFANIMLAKVDDKTLRLTLAALMVAEDDVEAKMTTLQEVWQTMGEDKSFTFLAGFTLHMANVSERLAAGLPAHEGDDPDPEAVEQQVQSFADALRDATPEDFSG